MSRGQKITTNITIIIIIISNIYIGLCTKKQYPYRLLAFFSGAFKPHVTVLVILQNKTL